MDIAAFWSLVDRACATAGSDVEARPEALVKLLTPLSKVELESFQQHYDRLINQSYRWDLWGAAYIINGGCSDDGFRYFRDWLISEGRAVFERAMTSPDALADLPPIEESQLEDFGYAVADVCAKKGFGHLTRIPSTEAAGPIGKDWEESDLEALLPKLFAKY